jgi:hypothetical protein
MAVDCHLEALEQEALEKATGLAVPALADSHSVAVAMAASGAARARTAARVVRGQGWAEALEPDENCSVAGCILADSR